jgi:hypothetical protein
MANEQPTRGGTHEQHVKAGEQSHKKTSGSSQGGDREREKSNEESSKGGSGEGSRGGSHEQHVKAGQKSHKNS